MSRRVGRVEKGDAKAGGRAHVTGSVEEEEAEEADKCEVV